MKENKKPNKIQLKKVLPILSGAGFMTVSAVLVVASTGLSVQGPSTNTNQKYVFDNQTFNSSQELLEYSQASYFKGNQTVDNRYRWSIDEKGEKVYFNDPKLLREHLSKRINTSTALSSSSFTEDLSGIGEINDNDFSKLYFNQSADQLKTEIYRGKNNSIHASAEAAKDSYLSIHDAYYFNNIYFKNIEDLRLYLTTNYYVNGGDGVGAANTNQNIGIIGPDGIVSSAMNVKDLFEPGTEQTKKDFMNNINNQAKKYLEFKDKDGKYFYANQEDLSNPSADLINAFSNPSYTKLYSNQGKSTFVIDLDREDPNTLSGPYYVKSNDDILKIKDPDNWDKIESGDNSLVERQNSDMIANLMNMILIEDESIDQNTPLNIKYLNTKYIKPLLNTLESKHKNIYNKWIAFNAEIQKGQKYNSFYNLPLSFMFILENLIEESAGEDVINELKKTFTTITKYLDYVISLLFPAELLKTTSGNSAGDKTLSLTEIFNFNNNNADWNVDISYFIDEITRNFSEFINAINVFSQASLNAMYNGGLLPYREDFIKQLLNIKGELSPGYSKLYKNIWDIFSSTDMQFIKESIPNINNKKYNPNETDLLTDITISISTTNSLFSNSAKFVFEENIKSLELSDEHNLLKDFKLSNGNLSSIGEKVLNSKNTLTWNNYMLIKFINNANPNLLEKFEDFNSDQFQLLLNLQNLIKDISLEKYTVNFVIEPKTVDNFAIISKSTAMSTKFLNHFIDLGKWINNKNTVDNLTKQITKFSEAFEVSDITNSKGMKKLLNIIGGAKNMALFAKGIPYAQVALAVLDLAIGAFVPKTTYSSYKFTPKFSPDNTTFIWNGGQTTTMFFGLFETSSVDINDIKLLDPQRIVKTRPATTLYFNGKRYTPENMPVLKKDQLKWILNQDNFKSDNIKTVYSFDNISTIGEVVATTSRNDSVFENFGTIEDLLILEPKNQNYLSLVQYVYNKIFYSKDGSNPEYHAKKFVFANGHSTINPGEAATMNINYIMDNIQSVKIALMPKLYKNKPKSIDGSNEDDGSVAEYTMPSLSWSASGTMTNRTNNEYIIFDPNQKSDLGKIITDGEAEDNVRKLFYASFDVDEKTVIKNEVNTNNMFSELSSSINNNYIYEATLSNNLTKYFFNESDAFNWLLTEENFTLYSYKTETPIYEYQGQIFNSKDEFINFILENATLEDK